MEGNLTGIVPVEYKVLVRLDQVEEKTKGGLYIPPNLRDEEQLAQTTGVLIAVGPLAFSDWGTPVPQVGDRVVVARYPGMMVQGKDGTGYQLCNDKEISAIIEV